MRSIKTTRWHQAIVGVTAIAITGSSLPAMAEVQTLAQATPVAAPTLVGQCREAKVSTPIFSQRSTTSATTALLAAGQRATLAENAVTDGFILVSAPSRGYVQAVNFRLCSNAGGTPVGDKALCRRVVPAQGLTIRQGPNTTAAIVGGAEANSQVYLTTNPATSRADADRVWVQIARPVGGWVSNGFRNSGATNLVFCQ